MPVLGMNFNEINGKKEDKRPNQEVKVNSTPVITEVREIEVSNIKKKVLAIDFDFISKYEPDYAKINIKGSLMYLTENNKKAIDEFKKNNKLPDNMSLEVLNYLFRHCLLKSAVLADDLQLPPPMPMPRITPKKE